MFLFEKHTLIRGRSLVPMTFLRIRQWRSCPSLCFFSVLTALGSRICRGHIFTEQSCLPCGRPFHPPIARPCPCKVPADRSCGFPPPPCLPPPCPALQLSAWCFPPPSP